MGNNPSHFKGAQKPVEVVSWLATQLFCRKAGNGLRLPTEAEWEYACRAGSTKAYCFGDDVSQLDAYAWLYQNSGEQTHPVSLPGLTCFQSQRYYGTSGQQTHPVGQKKPNAWGLYDMHGNVWEWCQDWYGNYPSGAVTDPLGVTSGRWRVYRGGSWCEKFGADICYSAKRCKDYPWYANDTIGFRVASDR
jgi:formylglycine-generating enzyme required for sulfatase activity